MISLDDFLTDINSELKEADESSLLRPVMILLRDALRDIGFGYTCIEEETREDIVNGIFMKPLDMIKVIDVAGPDGIYNSVRIGQGHNTKKFHYKEFIDRIVFPGKETSCKIKFYTFPKNEDNLPMIGDSVHSAVKEYAISRLLNTRPNHPDFKNRFYRQEEANRLIDKSRSELHSDNNSSNRFKRNWYK